MPATALSRAELRAFLREGWRYGVASAAALVLDVTAYLALIHLGDVHYLVAAPIAFMLGLALVYFLSARWAFTLRRYADARVEFAIFAAIGLAGLGLNQAVIYAGVSRLALTPEAAKLVSAALVFLFNFSARKLLLFTRYGDG